MKQASDAEEVVCVDMSDYDMESPFYKVQNFREWYKGGCRICAKEKEEAIKFGQEGSVFLIKMPVNGMKDLIKIKKVFNLDISTSKLLALSKELPCLLMKDITYAKAAKLMEKIGQVGIFEFRANVN